MYVDHELDVTRWIEPGRDNTLAVKVTPERALQDVNGVELADSWYDWINWKYLGYRARQESGQREFVCRRPQCGIWKPVYLGVGRGGPRPFHGELQTAAARAPIPHG